MNTRILFYSLAMPAILFCGHAYHKPMIKMKPRITYVTLGVDDLERSLRFYRDGLGLPTKGIIGKEFEHGAVAFFDLHRGLKLALWPAKTLPGMQGLQRLLQAQPSSASAITSTVRRKSIR